MFDPTELRARMVEDQLAARHISDPRVLEAFRQVPRHCFVPREYQDQAYDDRPLPIGLEQTISQPYMVACMTELLDLRPGDRVLEIGTGSGYQTAILSLLASEVVTIERHAALQARARACLGQLRRENIHFVVGDGCLGHPDRAPYDAILVTAGSPEIPPALVKQLANGGRLLCPVGGRSHQQLQRMEKQGSTLHTTAHTDCIFVPLRGRNGWPDEPN